MDSGKSGRAVPVTRDPRFVSKVFTSSGIFLLSTVALAVSHVLLSRLGVEFFLITLVALFFGSILTVISFKHLQLPFLLLVLSIGGFRYLWAVQAPILPDLYLDRMALIWLTMVFMVKFFAEGRSARKPWTLDFLILAHFMFMLVRILLDDQNTGFHLWTMSIMIPYAVYFFAKNIIHRDRDIRVLFGALFILGVYYSVTSIAEKFDINWLLWPRYMIVEHTEFTGRSNGPFRNCGFFGNTIGMLLPIHLYFIATTKRNFIKILLMISMGLGFAGLYFTYTRGSWLAGIAGLVTVALINRKQYLKTLMPLVVLVPFIAIIFLGIGQDKFMKERVENDNTIGSRIGTQITALRIWKDHPVFGCGTFSYLRYRGEYIDPISVPVLGTIRFKQFRGNNAHDMYLGPLAEDGLFGMGLQFAIYAVFIRTLIKKFRLRGRNNHFALLVIPIFAGIAANYLVGGITISYRQMSMLGTLFYMAAGITDGYNVEEQPDDPIASELS